jgi:uridine kinase
LLGNPLFYIGLLIRLAIVLSVTPYATSHWYIPFLSHSIIHPSWDPWGSFLELGGEARSFPYGYAMWAAFLPLSIVCQFVGINLYWGYVGTLLVFDIALLFALKAILATPIKPLLSLYWLSPILIFATYWLGFNDLLPITLLCLALLNVRRHHMKQAGMLCGVAVSAKLSMAVAVPLIVIYIWRNHSLRHLIKNFLLGGGVALAVLGLPFLASTSAMRMLLSNPEMGKVYDFTMTIGQGDTVYVLPLSYILSMFLIWRMRRISFELFLALTGIVFFIVVLLTPASPGWFLWALPCFVQYQSNSGTIAKTLVGAFSVLYVALNFLGRPDAISSLNSEQIVAIADKLNHIISPHGVSLMQTGMLSLGIILMLTMFKHSVQKNDSFRISRYPIMIGVAGDSGSGKDTLVESLAGLFGAHSTVKVSGDDYHLWDRHKPIWQFMTHLNPRANDLAQFTQDIIRLRDGQTIHARHYDHGKGQKSRQFKRASSDFVLTSGLHALYLPLLRECYDLSIYLDIDEDLRRYFKLSRDTGQRGHTQEDVLSSLDKREADARRFVRPQANNADLILSLQPIHPRILEDVGSKHPLRLKLNVRAPHGGHEEALLRVLVGICGLHVDMKLGVDGSYMEIVIEGEASPEDIALAASYLMPDIYHLLDISPLWEDGTKGLMQLVVLCYLNQALRKRLI